MSKLHRQKRGNGPTTVVEGKGSGETHDEAGAHPQFFGDAQPTEGHQALSGSTMSQNPCAHRTVSSSSSGYVSSDSVPSSPLTPPPYMSNKSTQTPSLSSQTITHAVQRLSQTQLSPPSDEPWVFQPAPPSASQPAPAPVAALVAVGDMQPEESVARELRRIGDEFNLLYFHEPHDEGNGQAVLARLRHQLPNGPGVMLFIGLLIGRLFQYIMRRR